MVPVGHQRLQVVGQRLAKSRVRHVQRLQNVPVHVVIKLLSGHALHNVCREGRGVVRICRDGSWRENLPGQMRRQIFRYGLQFFFGADEKIPDYLRSARPMSYCRAAWWVY